MLLCIRHVCLFGFSVPVHGKSLLKGLAQVSVVPHDRCFVSSHPQIPMVTLIFAVGKDE